MYWQDIIKSFKIAVISILLLSCNKPDDPNNNPVNPPVGLKADLLDLRFNIDCRAYDGCGLNNVTTNLGSFMSCNYNEYYKLYSVIFSGDAGQIAGSGYYRIHYSENSNFIRGIKDGFTMETLFSPDQLTNNLCGILSNVSDGGFGICIEDKSIVFIIKTDGGTIKIKNTEKVQSGRFYHVVGVWDYASSSVKLYIDGKPIGKKSSSGNLVFPKNAARWLCLGGNSSTNVNYANNTFNGEIAIAKIYNKAVSQEDVATLYDKVRRTQNPISFSISDLAYLSQCKVAHGSSYYIYGKGFAQGDIISLKSRLDNSTLLCETSFISGALKIIIPQTINSGTYVISVLRSEQNKVLGNVNFTIAQTAETGQRTGVLAHRCVHNNTSGPYENSLEALILTQETGVWGAEFDCMTTTDGVVIVSHDAVVSGKNIQNSTYTQIRDLKLPLGEKLPTLEEFLVQGTNCPSVNLTFEIKSHNSAEKNNLCIDKVVELLNKGIENKLSRQSTALNLSQITVTSYNFDILTRLHSKMPGLSLAYHGNKSPDELYYAGIKGLAYSMNIISANPDWIERAHELGMKVTVWTPSTVADAMTFIGLNVDLLTTNNVSLMKELTERVYIE